MGLSAAFVVFVGVSCGGSERTIGGDLSLADVEAVFSSNGITLIESVSPAEPGSCLKAVLVPRETAGDDLDVSVLCNESAARTLFRQVAGDIETNQAQVDNGYVFQVRNVYVIYRPSDEISLEDVETVVDELARV